MNPNWSEYEKLVMYRLDKVDEKLESLSAAQANTNNEVIRLRAMASMFGAIAGAITSFLTSLFTPQKG